MLIQYMIKTMSLIKSKKVYFNYELLDKYSAGLELLGTEVKALRAGHGSLEGAYIKLINEQAVLIGATIPPFQVGNAPEDYDTNRPRNLLLTKKELTEIKKKLETRGLTLVPISVYNKGRKLKLDLAIARGKKEFDKRETIKKRETDRDIRRTLKNKY